MSDGLDVYCMTDPAVDAVSMGETLQEYIEGRDASLVKVKLGCKAARFRVKRIPTSIFSAYIQDASTQSKRFERAFQVGVESIRDLVDVEGSFVPLLEPDDTMTTANGVVRVYSTKQLERLPPAFIEEVGAVAYFRGYLPPKSVGAYPAPLSVLSALGQRLRHLAAEQTETSTP